MKMNDRTDDPRGFTFIHAHGFDEDWKDLGFSDENLWILQRSIQANPEGAPVVKGTGGLRKVRFAAPKKSGRRKWCRVGYVVFPDAAIVLLVIAYAKNESDDLSPEDKNFIREMIERQQKILSRRSVK